MNRLIVAHLRTANAGNGELEHMFSGLNDTDWTVDSWLPGEPLSDKCWQAASSFFYVAWPEWCLSHDDYVNNHIFLEETKEAIRIFRKAGGKVVWQLNNLFPHEVDTAGVVDDYFKWFTEHVDIVVSRTQSNLDLFLQYHPRLRGLPSIIIGFGDYTDIVPFQALSQTQARTVLGLPLDKCIGGVLGVVRRYKNPELAADVAIECGDSQFMLVIAGACNDSRLIRQLGGRARSHSSVDFRPAYLSEAELANWLAALDFVLVPTSLATTSGVASLAVAHGCPVVLPERGEYVELQELAGKDRVWTYRGGFRGAILKKTILMAMEGRHEGRTTASLGPWSQVSSKLKQGLQCTLSS